MYDNFKVANYSGSLVSPELYGRTLSRLFTGEVIDGLTVVPKTGRTVTLKPGNAFVRYGSTNVASARFVSLVAGFDLTHDAADVSNPRIDLVVLYVDNSETLPGGSPTSANLDGPGVAKAKIVKGSPAATPVAPNSSAIQSSVGAGNPYVVIAQVRMDAGVTVIAANKITDVREISYAQVDPRTWWEEIGRTTLDTQGNVLSVSFAVRKYLKIFIRTPNVGSIQQAVKLNNDSGVNYSRSVYNFATSTYSTAVNSSSNPITGVAAQDMESSFEMINQPGTGKLFRIDTNDGKPTNAGVAPGTVRTGWFYWSGAAQVNRIDIVNTSSGDFAAGSEIVVLGHD